jgi:2-C-methyl-D-erythritol 4-phosphate cytidylyltransferase
MKNNSFDAVILAAGKGRRYKSLKPKQYTKINNKNLIDIAVEKILKTKEINNIFIVVDNKKSYSIPSESTNLFLINGGSTRTKSVYNALQFMSSTKNLSKNVLIHDAARPCVSLEDMKKIIYYSRNSTTGISPGYPLTNALKRVNKNSIVIDNLKRNNLYMSFTPQAYNFSKLLDAYNVIIDKKIQVDDEIEAMAQLNYKVKIIRTSIDNIKLTYIDDLNVIQRLMNKK